MGEFIWNSRKAFRIAFEVQTAFRLHRHSKKDIQLRQKTVGSKLIDLSVSGCALESSSFVPAGTKINVFLNRNLLLPSGEKGKEKNYTRIVGVVKTSKQMPGRKYRLGIEFQKVSPSDHKLIQEFIDRNNRRENPRIQMPGTKP